MSIKVMSKVWEESRASGNALLLMMAISDHADDNGLAFPGVESLARKIRMTPQSVYNLSKELIATGELFKISRSAQGKSNLYIVMVGITYEQLCGARKRALALGGDQNSLPPLPQEQPPAFEGGDKVASVGGDKTAVLPESSVNHQSNHNESLATTASPPATFHGWLQLLRNEPKKQIETMMWMFSTLFPDRRICERENSNEFGYLGAIKKRLGAERLAELLWQASIRPPVGDILAYVQGVAKNGGNGNGAGGNKRIVLQGGYVPRAATREEWEATKTAGELYPDLFPELHGGA